jgi:hypothetical protein
MTYDTRYQAVASPRATVDAAADVLAADGFDVTRSTRGDVVLVNGRDNDRQMSVAFFATWYGEVALGVTQDGCYANWPE